MTRYLVLFVSAVAACAQPAIPVFDVASIHTAAVVVRDPHAIAIHATPTSVTMRSVTLKGALAWSWGVSEHQVKGPGWLDAEHYDVLAKTEKPQKEDALRQMFQALLAERFGVGVHRERKEMQAWVLTVDKKGLKMTETQAEGESSMAPVPKRQALALQRASMGEFAALLSRVLQTPVVDETQLKGRYDAVFDMSKYAQDMRGTDGAPADPSNIVTTALREEMGLRIALQKTLLEMVVVDRAEKLPQAN